MDTPILEINLNKISYNAKYLKDLCDGAGIELFAVTKGFCAKLPIVKAIISSGIRLLADSRIQNIIKVKKELAEVKYMLVRIPKVSEAEDVIKHADISLQSQPEIIKAYSDIAASMNKTHKIILMVDVGDLREGVMPENVFETVDKILAMSSIELIGIGSNVGCYGGVMPTVENSNLLVRIKKDIEKSFGINLKYISAGSTCTTKLLMDGNLPKEINNFRVGEAIILGEDSTNGIFIKGMHQDAFILKAEVVELSKKPSVPTGEIGYDAFGCKPTFVDKGIRKRAILAIGKQDVRIEALTPIYEGMEILGGSSDHLLLDITDCKEIIKAGSIVPFRCAYSAVLTLTTSPYVYKKYI